MIHLARRTHTAPDYSQYGLALKAAPSIGVADTPGDALAMVADGSFAAAIAPFKVERVSHISAKDFETLALMRDEERAIKIDISDPLRSLGRDQHKVDTSLRERQLDSADLARVVRDGLGAFAYTMGLSFGSMMESGGRIYTEFEARSYRINRDRYTHPYRFHLGPFGEDEPCILATARLYGLRGTLLIPSEILTPQQFLEIQERAKGSHRAIAHQVASILKRKGLKEKDVTTPGDHIAVLRDSQTGLVHSASTQAKKELVLSGAALI